MNFELLKQQKENETGENQNQINFYNYCKENNIRFYPFFLRNPKWGNFDLVIPVKVDGDNKITVSKANLDLYILPGGLQSFDEINFFENQDLIIAAIN